MSSQSAGGGSQPPLSPSLAPGNPHTGRKPLHKPVQPSRKSYRTRPLSQTPSHAAATFSTITGGDSQSLTSSSEAVEPPPSHHHRQTPSITSSSIPRASSLLLNSHHQQSPSWSLLPPTKASHHQQPSPVSNSLKTEASRAITVITKVTFMAEPFKLSLVSKFCLGHFVITVIR